ncbi:ras GTPase-activating protein 4-like isoform X6 [Pan paniscus]|uniref:ras GTPase-activating protein 4-like isoform X6 n=1 Tax=Pan paniscus TaxID=9597 RepID=UPI0030076FC2
MSRDCGWRSRRRAGSGCSPTSPRAGGMTRPRAADPTHRGDKQHRVSPGRGHEPAQALPGAGAGQGLPGPALPAGAESHQWPGCSTCTASWSPSSTRCLRRRSTWSWTPAKWKLRMCSGLHRPQTEAEVLEQSAQTLRAHLGALLSALSRSVHACPAVVRATFRQLFRRVRERFPGAQHENVPFIAVTSFLCLRFFSPAIVSPKLFHLRERHADARTSRTPLLLAKAVQNVGNMDTPASRAKEAWMEPLQPTVRQGVAQLKDFITKLVDIEEKDELDLQRTLSLQAPPVKEGPLFIHRTKGKGPLMSSSFKKLYFSLTTEALSFAKTPSSKKSALIKLANIRAAEKVEEKSFGSLHVMQVIYTDDAGRPQTAYLQCKDSHSVEDPVPLLG